MCPSRLKLGACSPPAQCRDSAFEPEAPDVRLKANCAGPQVIDVEFPLYLRYQVSQHHDEAHEVRAHRSSSLIDTSCVAAVKIRCSYCRFTAVMSNVNAAATAVMSDVMAYAKWHSAAVDSHLCIATRLFPLCR